MAIDTSGTPLDKKETTDIKNIEMKGVETTPQTSSQSYSEPTKTESLSERIKRKISGGVQYIKETPAKVGETIKREVTVANVKKYGGQIVSNVGENMKSDVGYLGQQTVATIKPTKGVSSLFHGEGSFAPDVFGHMRTVKVVSKKKSKKNKVVIKNKTANIENVGVVGSVFGSSSTKQSSKISITKPKNIHSIGVVSDPFHGAFNSKVKAKNINSIGVLPKNTFGGSGLKVKPLQDSGMNLNTLNNMKRGTKLLNNNKSNNTNMYQLDVFKKKRRIL